ncbi:unnamed protein product [Pleuronectes platessa]|uniref:Uncharacterized protein n=1 Tax=Pleuronectes platessa TaxID=8262 RepID=A0A9N7UE98_PLEPL|nr:unnamed protein product [Pleuronectes platessa]
MSRRPSRHDRKLTRSLGGAARGDGFSSRSEEQKEVEEAESAVRDESPRGCQFCRARSGFSSEENLQDLPTPNAVVHVDVASSAEACPPARPSAVYLMSADRTSEFEARAAPISSQTVLIRGANTRVDHATDRRALQPGGPEFYSLPQESQPGKEKFTEDPPAASGSGLSSSDGDSGDEGSKVSAADKPDILRPLMMIRQTVNVFEADLMISDFLNLRGDVTMKLGVN